LQVFKDDFVLLIEAGFMAVKKFDEDSARKLFLAAHELRPSHSVPFVGLSYISLNKMDYEAAIETLEPIVKEEPDNYLAAVLLGIGKLMDKDLRSEGEAGIRAAIGKTDDPTVKNLGDTALLWSEKDLKKSKAPFFS